MLVAVFVVTFYELIAKITVLAPNLTTKMTDSLGMCSG